MVWSFNPLGRRLSVRLKSGHSIEGLCVKSSVYMDRGSTSAQFRVRGEIRVLEEDGNLVSIRDDEVDQLAGMSA
jgi:hypothetical protein